MKHLHFDIVSGISGDMTVGALIHLGAPLKTLSDAFSAMDLSGCAPSNSQEVFYFQKDVSCVTLWIGNWHRKCID